MQTSVQAGQHSTPARALIGPYRGGDGSSPPVPALSLAEQSLQEDAYDVDKPDHDSTKDGKNWHSNPLAKRWSLAPTQRLGRASPITA